MTEPSLPGPAPRVLDANLQAFDRLSAGNDSHVYRLGDQVAKEYQKLSLDDVARYVALQNAAARVLPGLGYRAEVNLRGTMHALVATEAIPVDELALSRAGRPLTLSRYVAAPNLEKLAWRPDKFAEYARKELADPSLREFAAEMNAFLWDEYPTRVQDELHYHVCMLSRLLDRELGVSGLYISKYNVKLHPVAGEARIDLVITDLALYIDRVRHPGRGA
jgi:hypothetical protein